jgi:signal transduction histidine kinase/HPt (histidine-containing phosphotransfer) domain-containing protein/ActR/RegA family two-component response regulator
LFRKRSTELSKLPQFLDQLGQAILMQNPTGEILIANTQFCELFNLGTIPEKIVGQSASLLFDRIAGQITSPISLSVEINTAIATKEKKKGKLLKLVNDKLLLVDITPILNDKNLVQACIIVFTDVSSSLQSEHDKHDHQHDFFQGILNQIPFEIAVLDPQQNYLFVNWELANATGNRSWIVGKTDEALVKKGDLSAEDATARRAYFLKAINSKSSVEFQETIQNKKTGTKHFFRAYYPVLNEEYGVSQVINVGIDITERVQTEQQLTTAKLRAEKSMRAKESFLAKVSHELRTPMNGLLGILEILKSTTLTERQSHYIDVLQRSSKNLLRIVNDVLDIEKISIGKFEADKIVFNLRDKLFLLRDVYSAQALQKDLKFSLTIYEPIHSFYIGDPIRISQVIGNLLSNAIKFTSEGGVELQVRQEQISPDKCIIECKIIDTGLGFQPDLVETIFEPFSQLNKSLNEVEKGTGLGLSICRDIAELLEGDLQAASNPGIGSTFTFRYPLVITSDAPITDTDSLEGIDVAKLAGKRILLAEDMELNQIVMKEMLSDKLVKVDLVENGKEAVEYSQANLYDYILMDIKMPVMDGIEAAKLIRSTDNLNQHTPIIAISANGFEKDRISYLQAGMNDVLVKPITTSMLLKALLKESGTVYEESDTQSIIEEGQFSNEISIDLSYLMRIGGNNKEFIPLMLRSFCTSAEEILVQLDEAIESNDWEKTALLVHKIKFSLGVLGIKSLNSQIEWLESNARQIIQVQKQQYLIQLLAMKSIVNSLIEEARQLIKTYSK